MKIKLSLALASIFFILFPQSTFASTNTVFTTSPNNFLVQVLAGNSVEETVGVINLTNQKETLHAAWQSYSLAKNQTVSDNFLNQHNLDFAQVTVDQIELEPFAKENLTVGFNPPDVLKAGDYYGTLLLSDGVNEKQVSFTVRILGTLSESISANNFKDDGHSFSFILANTGNRSTINSVSVQINNLIGPELKLNFNQSLTAGQKEILLKTHRQLLPGFYQVKIENTFGDKQTTQTLLYSFWVRPEFFVVSLLTLILTVLIFLSIRKTYRDV